MLFDFAHFLVQIVAIECIIISTSMKTIVVLLEKGHLRGQVYTRVLGYFVTR